MKAKTALRKANWSEAEQLAIELASDPALEVKWRSEALWDIASARTAQGRIREARTALQEMIEMNQRAGRGYDHRRAHQNLLILSKAAGLNPEPWRLEGLESDTTERARVLLGLWAAELGDAASAHSYARALPPPELGEFDTPSAEQAFLAVLHGRVAAVRGDWEETVRLLERVTGDRTVRPRFTGQLANWLAAEASERLGQLDSAAGLYDGIATGYRLGWDGVMSFGFTYSFAHRRAALLYTRLEDYDRAEEHWLAFLDAFTDPDPEFEWMVEEARTELERIGRGR
jgi:tetratricopeptide (TPR) repeat protein